jgi:type II secretory pathway component PulK
MLIVFTLAAIVVVFCRSQRVEAVASANLAAALQASSVERGAEQYVLAILTEQKDSLADITQDYFAAVPVGEGFFWIVRPNYGDTDQPLFGLVDEAGKLNINTAEYEPLIRLPNMTDDVANAIIDWRTESSSGGSSNTSYSSLGYTAKHAPFETVEEMLLVQGMSRDLLYGANAGTGAATDGGNGAAAAVPLGQAASFQQSNSRMMSDLQTANGLYDLLTVYSNEPAGATTTGTGSASGSGGGAAGGGGGKININQLDAAQTGGNTGRTGSAAGSTAAGRTGSSAAGANAGTGDRDRLRQLLENQLGNTRGDQIVDSIGRGTRFVDVFDFYFKTGLKPDEFDKIFNSITTTTGAAKGRINVNTAPRDVLMTLPGLESSDVDKLIAQRQTATSSATAGQASMSWVATALDKKAVGLGTLITSTSNQFSADIVAVSGNGRAFKRVRIVIDASSSSPQIIYRRELTDRGWPMDQQILASLRAGQGPGSAGNLSGLSSVPGGNAR